MKQIMFTLVAAVCAAIVCSCVSSKDISAQMNKAAEVEGVVANDIRIIRNKTTGKEVLDAIGAPSLIFKNADQTETWVYSRIGVRRTNVGFVAKGNFAGWKFPKNRGLTTTTVFLQHQRSDLQPVLQRSRL